VSIETEHESCISRYLVDCLDIRCFYLYCILWIMTCRPETSAQKMFVMYFRKCYHLRFAWPQRIYKASVEFVQNTSVRGNISYPQL
jgi:amino acid permease